MLNAKWRMPNLACRPVESLWPVESLKVERVER